MDRFFDANNPLMRFLSWLVDLVIINVLTIVCALFGLPWSGILVC